jgi:hypothetical protein
MKEQRLAVGRQKTEQLTREEKRLETLYGPRTNVSGLVFLRNSRGRTEGDVVYEQHRDRVVYFCLDDETVKDIAFKFQVDANKIVYDNKGMTGGLSLTAKLHSKTPMALPFTTWDDIRVRPIISPTQNIHKHFGPRTNGSGIMEVLQKRNKNNMVDGQVCYQPEKERVVYFSLDDETVQDIAVKFRVDAGKILYDNVNLTDALSMTSKMFPHTPIVMPYMWEGEQVKPIVAPSKYVAREN